MALAQTVSTTTIDMSTKFVRGGPHLWVSKLLYKKGPLSSNRIWEEFLKD